MHNKTDHQLNFTLESLVNNLWIFTLLLILAEKDFLHALLIPVLVTDLEKKIGFNDTVLNNMINVLVEQGAMVRQDKTVYFSDAMKTLIESKGLTNVLLMLRLNQGKSAAIIQDIRQDTWRHGWYHQDELVLRAQGEMSEVVIGEMFTPASRLTDKFKQPGCKFVDIGAGVGRISLKACEIYPELSVVAIELADIPYKLAKQNIENSAYSHRIELRKILAHEITEENAFDVIWFPHGFLTDDDIYQVSIEKIYRALKPGGVLMSLTSAVEPGVVTLSKFVNSLTAANRSSQFLKDNFSKVGFENIELLPMSYGLVPMIAWKPR